MTRLPVLVELAIRRHLVALVGVFVVMGVWGATAPDAVTIPLIDAFKAFAARYRGLPFAQLFVGILFHNLVASFLAMISGVVFGIIPIASMMANGFMLGAMSRLATRAHGVAEVVSRILPHGVFELPAMFISAAYGLWLGTGVLARVRGREGAGVGERVGHAVRRYLTIVVPLLVVAAAIESALGVRRR